MKHDMGFKKLEIHPTLLLELLLFFLLERLRSFLPSERQEAGAAQAQKHEVWRFFRLPFFPTAPPKGSP